MLTSECGGRNPLFIHFSLARQSLLQQGDQLRRREDHDVPDGAQRVTRDSAGDDGAIIGIAAEAR